MRRWTARRRDFGLTRVVHPPPHQKRVIDCHADAFQHGLNSIATQESWPTRIDANLKSVHSKLCPDMTQSGRYRENRVRASNTYFTLPQKIQEEIDLFSMAVRRFQTKWASSSTAIMDDQQWCEQVYQKIAITAIVLFGINDIHPFQVSLTDQRAKVFISKYHCISN